MLKVALCGGTVIDGLDGVLDISTVLIENGKIKEVIYGDVCPEGYQKIDVSGKYIMPGLIEMHGHLFINTGIKKISMHEEYSTLYLAGGITTVRIPGDYQPDKTFEMKIKIEKREATGPRIILGSYFDCAPSDVAWIDASSSLDELMAKYESLRDKIDQVKVYNNMPAEWIKTIASAAHADGLKVYGYLNRATAREAIEAGIDGIEHALFGMPEFYDNYYDIKARGFGFERFNNLDPDSPKTTELIKLIVDNNVAITPVTIILKIAGCEFTDKVNKLNLWRFFDDYSREIQRKLRFVSDGNVMEVELQNMFLSKQNCFVNKIYEAGGKIFCGTNPVFPLVTPGYGLVWEAENLTKCGISNNDIIKALTSNAARELGIFSKTGSIEAGKDADIAVFRKNPLENISYLTEIDAVYKGGVYYNPEELRKSVEGKIHH